jgi:hypothetical protein
MCKLARSTLVTGNWRSRRINYYIAKMTLARLLLLQVSIITVETYFLCLR